MFRTLIEFKSQADNIDLDRLHIILNIWHVHVISQNIDLLPLIIFHCIVGWGFQYWSVTLLSTVTNLPDYAASVLNHFMLKWITSQNQWNTFFFNWILCDSERQVDFGWWVAGKGLYHTWPYHANNSPHNDEVWSCF